MPLLSSSSGMISPLGKKWSYPGSIRTTNRVLHVDATNYNSYKGTGTTWFDLSGNNNNLTMNGITFNASGWMNWDGGDRSATRASMSTTVYQYYTFFFVLRPDIGSIGAGTTRSLVYWSRSDTDTEILSNIGSASGKYNFQDWNNSQGGAGYTGTSNTTLTEGSWQTLAFTANNLNGTFYLNGVSDGTTTSVGLRTYGSDDFNLGKDSAVTGRNWKGDFAACLVYSVALTSTEIANIHQYYKSRLNF